MKKMIETVQAARLVSTPLIACATADQLALITTLSQKVYTKEALITWDAVRGFNGLNQPAQTIVSGLSQAGELEATQNPTAALDIARRIDKRLTLYMINAHRFVDEPQVSTAILNLRDVFKAHRRTLVLLGPTFRLPQELVNDVVLLDEELPTDQQLGAILEEIYAAAQLGTPTDHDRGAAVDAARSLPAFAAEQTFAMSLARDSKQKVTGLDIDAVWTRKRATINQTKGLTLTRGGPTFGDLGGLQSVIGYAKRLFDGPHPPTVIVLIDEVEKAMAGAFNSIGDNTGVAQDAHGYTLSWMEEHDASGMISVGPGGSGKSFFARALASTYGLPLLTLDYGAMKEGTVGASEGNVRAAFKVIEGLGHPFFVATCNEIQSIPTPLRRRFRGGVWYFDLLTPSEREAVWPICLKRYGLDARMKRPTDDNWTGAEIRNCCELARDLKCSLVEASQYVVPVAVADAMGIERLRGLADGKFLSASAAGVYRRNGEAEQMLVAGKPQRRSLTYEGES